MFLICLQIVIVDEIKAQTSVSIGYGISTYKGDLSLNNFIDDLKHLGPAFSLSLKYPIFRRTKLRFGYFMGQLQADDSNSTDLAINIRNLNFFSTIHEFSLGGEYLISDLIMKEQNPIGIYVLGGLAYFDNKPYTNYNGLNVELAPLGTEGQAAPYSTSGYALMIGGGLQIDLNASISITIELIGRLTGTDYLDDVSGDYPDYSELSISNGFLAAALSDRRDEFLGAPEGTVDIVGIGESGRRGNPNSKDYYGSLLFSFLIRLGQSENNSNKGILCPSM